MTWHFKTQRETQCRVLEALKAYPDGATVNMLKAATCIHTDRIKQALEEINGVYIDRYGRIGKRGPNKIAIWMAVEVPENCPKPDGVN